MFVYLLCAVMIYDICRGHGAMAPGRVRRPGSGRLWSIIITMFTIHACTYIYIYIYIEREREGERENVFACLCLVLVL